MPNLTDDERAVLMIAAQDQYMAPIGRWKQPIENLTMLGLMKKLDPVNFVITENGRKILAGRQLEEDEDFRRLHGQYQDNQNARQQAVLSSNEAAAHLATAAKAAAKLSQLTPEQECWSIGQGAIQRALELLKQ